MPRISIPMGIPPAWPLIPVKLRREQASGMCRDSRVVCLTANVGVDMETRYREAGFDGYLVKPVRGKTLEEEIARLLPPAQHTES